ncbi:hypothetical protein C8F04DRAFT_51990 [Mycena alexandri]|uniref:Uncharacterized protein n=1 Tax=Mycena alexandri TaxID=1745969 RepID=A0AAD6WXC9_9AGAR|nr:hypothetical protein C8F04DRAFT_51990 [Mycena alexandri]
MSCGGFRLVLLPGTVHAQGNNIAAVLSFRPTKPKSPQRWAGASRSGFELKRIINEFDKVSSKRTRRRSVFSREYCSSTLKTYCTISFNSHWLWYPEDTALILFLSREIRARVPNPEVEL